MNKAITWAATMGVVLALGACGGGGGGDKPDPSPPAGNNGNPPSSAPGLQLSTQQLQVRSEHGDAQALSAIDGVVNNATAPVYVYVTHTNNALESVWFNRTSNTGGRLMLMHKPAANLAAGNYSDAVRVDVCYDSQCNQPVTGSPKTVNVSYTVEAASPPSALMLSHEGVAFTKAPFGSRLSQRVSVTQSGTPQGNWTASTTAGWLQVTASGQAGDALQLTADPHGLAPGQYMTWVTVQASNTRPAAIRVGLYVSATTSATAFANTLGSQQVENDPARPHVYSLSSGSIAVDHIYTGQRLGMLSVPGRQLSEMHVSRNGTRILASDADGSRIWLLNTDTQGVEGSYALPPPKSTLGETRRTPVVLKANGRNVMVVVGLSPHETRSGYYMVDLDTGLPLPGLFTAAMWEHDTLYVGPDGRHFMVRTALSPNSLYWGTLTENSKGTIYQDSRTGGNVWGLNRIEYLNSDFIVGNDPQDTFTCQGNVYQSGIDYVILDSTWFDHLTWQNAQPVYVGLDYNKRCRGVERYEDDLLLLADQLMSELQVRQHDGTLVRTWTITSGLAGMKLSSDQLRVFDNHVMQDLPR